MLALLCDTCRNPIEHEGFELTLMPGAVVSGPNEFNRFAAGPAGVISAYMCRRCGERIAAILRHKLQDPCAVCEVAPMREGDRRASETELRQRAVS
jgi:hypothetical protein